MEAISIIRVSSLSYYCLFRLQVMHVGMEGWSECLPSPFQNAIGSEYKGASLL